MLKQICATLLLALVPFMARAHYLWIESDAGAGARVYFGEFNEGVREKAGGRLDERDALEVRILRGDGSMEALPVSKQSDHFAVKSTQSGWLFAQDLTSEVKDWSSSDIGIVKPMFYARAFLGARLSEAQPALTLDIIPDPKNPRRLQVLFHNQPLAKAKVMVHAPNEWSKELEADGSGAVTIATPWPGRYVLEVIHKEREPGEFDGKRYEAIRHRVTFSHIY